MTPDSLLDIRPEFSPLSLARMLWKQKVYLAAVWLLGCLATFVTVSRLPVVYKAEILILVDSQKIPERYVSSTVNVDVADRLATISKQILSSTRLQKIIEAFNLYPEERRGQALEEVIVKMRSDIKVNLERGWAQNRPGAFRVSYESSNRGLVAEVANQLGNLFIEENLRARETQAEGTSEFIETQLQGARKRLEEQEGLVSRYKIQHNGELPQQENSLVGALGRLQVQLQGNQDAINRAQQSKVALENAISLGETTEAALNRMAEQNPWEPSAGVRKDPAAPTRPPTKSELMQAQLDALKLRYSESHPDVRRLEADVQAVRKQEEREAAELASWLASLPKPETPAAVAAPPKRNSAVEVQALRERGRTSDLKAQIALLVKEMERRTQEREQLVKEIASYQSRVEGIPIREQEMAGINRDYDISKGNYRSLLDKKFSAEMATEMERRQKAERFTVLDRAQTPSKPFQPDKPLLQGIGALAGLGLGIALALVKELKKNCLLGEWELPRNILILGRVSRMELAGAGAPAAFEPGGGTPASRWRAALISGVVLSLLGALAFGIYYSGK